MKTYKDIDIEQKIDEEDFRILFQHLPLNEKEKADLTNFYQAYEVFIEYEVEPKIAWLSIRNLWIHRNRAIANRIEQKQ